VSAPQRELISTIADAARNAFSSLFEMASLEAAMGRLDREGLFGTGPARAEVVVNVECMPPDRTSTERALRMNPPAALVAWLKEAAEET
jgi:uncharacterized protein DUF4303